MGQILGEDTAASQSSGRDRGITRALLSDEDHGSRLTVGDMNRSDNEPVISTGHPGLQGIQSGQRHLPPERRDQEPDRSWELARVSVSTSQGSVQGTPRVQAPTGALRHYSAEQSLSSKERGAGARPLPSPVKGSRTEPPLPCGSWTLEKWLNDPTPSQRDGVRNSAETDAVHADVEKDDDTSNVPFVVNALQLWPARL